MINELFGLNMIVYHVFNEHIRRERQTTNIFVFIKY
jgi:hypothetical protein